MAERVCSLFDLPEMKGKPYPRNLALALLQDWVFSQSRLATEKVVDTIFDDGGIRSTFLLESGRARFTYGLHSANNISLSPETGSSYFVESRLESLFDLPYSEKLRALCHIIGKQPQRDKDVVRQRWQSEFRVADTERRNVLVLIARWAGLFHPDMDHRLFENETDPNVLLTLIRNDFGNDFISASKHAGIVTASLRQADQFTFYSTQSGLGGLLSFTRIPLWYYSLQQRYSGIFASEAHLSEPTSEAMEKLYEIGKPLVDPAMRVATDLGPWRTYTQGLDAAFGESWTSTLLGLLAGGVKAQQRGAGADDLFSHEHSFCDRVRNARRRGNQTAWWEEQLDSADTVARQEKWMATAFCWASSDTLIQLFERIDAVLSELPPDSISRLAELSENFGLVSQRGFEEVAVPAAWIRKATLASPTFNLFFNRISDGSQKDRTLSKRANGPMNPSLANKMLQYAWRRWSEGFINEQQIGSITRKLYVPGSFPSGMLAIPSSFDRRELRPILEGFIENVDRIPDLALGAAEYEFRKTVKRPKHVLRVADKEKWFD